MDTILGDQFERVEKALGALVDSIAAYNPSPQAAIDLLTADDALSQGLDQLARHQANYARIQALQAETDALEEQLTSSVEKLATLRRELFDTPATTFAENSRPVPFDELLQYADNISKYTVPPTYRERVPDAAPDKDKEKEDTGSGGSPTNGVNTPANLLEPAEPPKSDLEGPKDNETANAAVQDITAEEEEWLKKLKDSQIAWHPWPSNDKIRQGNLFKLMYYREKNHNLDDFDIPKFEEEERLKNMPAAATAADNDTNQPQHQETLPVPGQPPARSYRPPRPKQEKFTLFDDMDDE